MAVVEPIITSPWMPFTTVLRREVTRFWSIKRQTLIGPLLETYLYISVFGAALGARVGKIDGVSYIAYIIPGLLLMAIAMNAFSNNSSSLLQQKFQKSIDDQLSSPVSNAALMVAYTLGGFLRGLIIAVVTYITASTLTDLPLVHPFVLLLALVLCGLFFASLGVLVGLRAETFDGVSFYSTFVIQPLIFLGGVFYSATKLDEPYRTLTHFDPIFYMINTVRYGMLGHSDVNAAWSLLVISIATVAVLGLNLRLFTKGYRLRS